MQILCFYGVHPLPCCSQEYCVDVCEIGVLQISLFLARILFLSHFLLLSQGLLHVIRYDFVVRSIESLSVRRLLLGVLHRQIHHLLDDLHLLDTYAFITTLLHDNNASRVQWSSCTQTLLEKVSNRELVRSIWLQSFNKKSQRCPNFSCPYTQS